MVMQAEEADWERFALAAQASLDGFWDVDLAINRAHFSPQWQRIAGFEATEHSATLEHWLDRVHPEDCARLMGELRALRMGKARQMRNEHRMRDERDERGGWRWVMVRAVSGHNEQGMVVRIAGAVTDQTERKMADPLTGLPNRLFFLHHMDRRFERARQTGDWNFSVLSLGLDRFKQINERLGYEGGDALLIEIAERLTDALGKWALDPESVIARLAAADFLLCLEGMANESQSMEAARRIAEDLRQPFQWRMRRVSPAPAIGLAQAEAAIAGPDELLHEADTALVEAKVAGRGPLVCYSRGMRERALARMQMEADLELAIREQIHREPIAAGQAAGQLALYYQPEIDLATRRIIGFEALARWQHPEHGMVMPGEFIPLAEESGLILPLGDWGLTEACRQIEVWKKMAGERPCDSPFDLRVSVNLSAKQFGNPGLVDRIADILMASSVDASDLRLEVTESSLMSHEDTAQATMQRLQKLGVGLHMDDFGTGYSSLNHLHRYPFDTLKIDRSFVQGIGQEKNCAEIVRTILDLAHSLDMDVVAEGIETEAQAEQLRVLGCRLGQGYFFSRPMAPDAIGAMFASA